MRTGRISATRICFAATVFLILGSSAVLTAQVGSDEILPDGKKSDGCTLIPDGHIRPCCLIHDREYFNGGSRDERRRSDERLFECVRKKRGLWHRFAAPFIWLGVRIGGLPFLPTKFRWGFGTRAKGYTDNPVEKDPPNRL